MIAFPALSADGRYVTFFSDASNLVPGDNNGTHDIFVYDRTTRTIERVSVSDAGVEGNGGSFYPALSADGRYVTFSSFASNLAAGDNNGEFDIFVYDRITRTIERVSVSDAAVEGNGDSESPALSADGRYVTFYSDASNLVPGDNNGTDDIFVYDRTTRSIERVSVSDAAVEGNGDSLEPALSADGRYVTFRSFASNLVPGDNNSERDIFIAFNPLATPGVTRNLQAGEIYSELSFGLVPDSGTISGRVFEDVVSNGVYDEGEPVNVETTVFLDLNNNRILDEGEPFATPDADGRYEFLNTDAYRSYTVAAQTPIGFEQIVPGANEDFVWSIFLPAGGVVSDRDFAFRKVQSTGQSSASAVSGRLYEDKNGNGMFDDDIDMPITNREVYLDATNFGVRDSNEPRVLTDSEGRYSIPDLSSRTVAVTTTLDETLIHVSPLGSKFTLQKFPLFAGVTPFGNPQAIAAGDFNADGFQDVAVALGEANKLSIRLNDGRGGFLSDTIDFDLGTVGTGPTSLVVGQFDTNPQLDVALTANFASNVTVLLNFDPQTNAFAPPVYIPVGQEPIDLVAGQFDGNAALDLVVVNKGNGSVSGDETVQVLINDGSGVFTAGPAIPTGGKDSVSIVAGDFTGDALLDVTVVHASTSSTTTPYGGVTVLRGDGAGGLTLEPGSYYEVGALPIDSVSADFDGDGRADVAVANFSSNSISVLRGQADGTFRVQAAILGTASGAFDIAVGDVDNDGDVDIVASNLKDRNISIFRNIGLDLTSGDVRFEPLENVGLGQFALAQRMPLVLVNFDNDTSGPGDTGTIDIVTIPQQTDTLHLLTNHLVNGSHRVQLTGTNRIPNLDFIIKPAILPPSFDQIANPAPIVEDGTEQSVGITGIVKGRTTGPPLQFSVTSSNPALIASPTREFADGSTEATIHYTPVANANGTAVITVRAVDAGADPNDGGADDGIFSRSFTVTVQPVNDPPTFTLPAEYVVTQKEGDRSIANFVTGIGKGGGDDELSQILSSFTLSTDASFFTVPPAIDAAGTLIFTPSPDRSGNVPVTVTLSDNGGKTNGGNDTTIKSFLINILPVNDAPSFVLGSDLMVAADAGPQTRAGFANGFVPGGGSDEASQVVSDFLVTTDAPGLFAVLPDISNSGTLTFTPAIDRSGFANVNVQVRDSGGQLNGGVDLSVVKSFVITVAPVPDTTRPAPVLSATVPALTNQLSFVVDVNFGEAVTGFALGDLVLSSGTASNRVDLSGGKYQFTYTGSDGQVMIGLPANVAQDTAGNTSIASNTLLLTLDTSALVPALSSSSANVIKSDTFSVSVVFGEQITDFTSVDVTALNGMISGLATVDANTGEYTFTVTATADGNINVLIPAGAVHDLAGNANTSSSALVRTVDRAAPAPTLRIPGDSPRRQNNLEVAIDFAEPVIGFLASKLVLSSGSAQQIVLNDRDTSFVVLINNVADGPLTVSLPAGAVTDPAGNSSLAVTSNTVIIDTSEPVPTISAVASATGGVFDVTITFDQNVTGLAPNDFVLTNATLSQFAGSGSAYTAQLTAIAEGELTIFLPEDRAADAVGNRNVDSNTVTLVYEVNQPITTIVLEGAGETVNMTGLADSLLSTVHTIDIRGTGANQLLLDAAKIVAFSPNQTLLVIADSGDEVVFDVGWRYSRMEVVDAQMQRIFTNGSATLRMVGPDSWTNPLDAGDVNANGSTTSANALAVINALAAGRVVNAQGFLLDASAVDPLLFKFYDVNRDNKLSALDALRVINQLAHQQGAGESVGVIGMVGEPTITFQSDSAMIDAATLADVTEKRQSFGVVESIAGESYASASDRDTYASASDRDSIASQEPIEDWDRTLSLTLDWLE